MLTHDEAFDKTDHQFNVAARFLRPWTPPSSIARFSRRAARVSRRAARYSRRACRRGGLLSTFILPRIFLICAFSLYASVLVNDSWGQNLQGNASPRDNIYGMRGVAQSPDIRWIESLIDDGFSSIAVEACESRLKLSSQDSDAYAQWFMLLMHAQTSLDLMDFDFSSEPKGLDAIRNKLDERSQTMRGMPRELWIRWKCVWCQWLIQQRALASYLAVPTREPLKLWVITSIRQSLDAIEQLQQDTRKLATGPGKAITNDQKLDLQGRLALLQADLLYQRSQCYPSLSDDRSAAAAEMLRSLDQALGKLPADWIHRPSLAIARIRGQILLGQYDDAITSANKLWDNLHEESDTLATSLQYEGALAVVGARANRLKGQLEEFHKWIERGGGPMASPELAIEQFASDLDRGGDQAAEKALEWKRAVGRQFGPYWEQRLDAMLVSNNNTPQRPSKMPSLEILRIEIRQLLTAKRWDEAIEKLRQAEIAATQLQAEEEAFAFGMQVAAAYDSQGQREQAATAFFETASRYATQPRAASASLMGAWLIRPGAGEGKEQSLEDRALYRERLGATASKWPTTDSAKQAIDWFERDCLAGDAIVPILQIWNERTGAIKKSSASIGRYLFGVCIKNDAWLGPGNKLDTELDEALKSLRGSIADNYNEVDRDRFRAWMTTTAFDLRWSSSKLEGDSGTWASSLAQLLSSGPKQAVGTEEALRESLSPWRDDPLARLGILWFACETRASEILSRTSAPLQQDASQFDALQKMLKAERDSESACPLGPVIEISLQRSIRFYEMLAAGISGDWSGILKQFEQERESNQKSAWWLYRGARVLQSIESRRQEAIPWYRLLASGFPSGSEPWLEARARTAQTMRWSGDSKGADQLRDLVFATYPASEPKWRERFDSQ